MQCFALIPGTSRSGASIVGGLFAGLNRVTATTLSFYMSIPILILAGVYKLISHSSEISSISGGFAGIGFGVMASFITALLVVNWLLKYITQHSFKIFVYYRFILGVVLLFMLA
jgi:undecaprenyl-diphosphatase